MAHGTGLKRSGGRGRDDLTLTADINVTSLVDVAFTLLVIFIITAPILQGGVEVGLPRADVQPISAMEDLFIVSITGDGRIFLEETELSLQEFEDGIGQLVEAGEIDQVYVRADSVAPYGLAFRVAAAVMNAGVSPAFIGEPRRVGR